MPAAVVFHQRPLIRATRMWCVLPHGSSPLQSAAQLYGARGGITVEGNCLCGELAHVLELSEQGDHALAIAEQRPLNRACDVLADKRLQVLKQVLVWQG
eukprot:gene1300-33410_t